MAQFVAHSTINYEYRLCVAFCRCWILDAPMNSLSITRKDWTAFVRVVANSYYIVEFLPRKLIY